MLNIELHKGTAVSGRGRRNYFSVDTQQEIMKRNAEWGAQKHKTWESAQTPLLKKKGTPQMLGAGRFNTQLC